MFRNPGSGLKNTRTVLVFSFNHVCLKICFWISWNFFVDPHWSYQWDRNIHINIYIYIYTHTYLQTCLKWKNPRSSNCSLGMFFFSGFANPSTIATCKLTLPRGEVLGEKKHQRLEKGGNSFPETNENGKKQVCGRFVRENDIDTPEIPWWFWRNLWHWWICTDVTDRFPPIRSE